MLFENVIIKRVSEVKTGTSETTGKPWASRVVLLSWEDETGAAYLSVAIDADMWDNLGYAEGQTVSLHLKCRTKRFMSGFIANDIRIINPQNA